MHIIEYDHNGRKASFDADQVFVHKATGDLYLRQSTGFLRALNAAERDALGGDKPGASAPAPAMPDLSNMTKEQIDKAAADAYGIELDRRKTKDAMLADFAAAWTEKYAA